MRDTNKIPKQFSRWNKKFLNFEKWTINKKISKAEACIRFTNSFKGIKKMILGVNNLGHLKLNVNFLKKKKLIVPKNLNIATGMILNPRKWKT